MSNEIRTELSSTPAAPAPSAQDYPGLDEWRTRAAGQQPDWRGHPDFDRVVADLEAVPPLVFAGEVDQMRARLAEVAAGRAFFLTGGDCA